MTESTQTAQTLVQTVVYMPIFTQILTLAGVVFVAEWLIRVGIGVEKFKNRKKTWGIKGIK